jgi:ethanolamine utilization protein EutA (predicted chaperonin)
MKTVKFMKHSGYNKTHIISFIIRNIKSLGKNKSFLIIKWKMFKRRIFQSLRDKFRANARLVSKDNFIIEDGRNFFLISKNVLIINFKINVKLKTLLV